MMSVLAASLRRPAPLIGSLVALAMSAFIIVIAASFIGTGSQATGTVDRLAGAAVVVTGSQQLTIRADSASETVPLPDYRRLPATLATRISALPGVEAAIPDESFPIALMLPGGQVFSGSARAPLAGHSWASAKLTPFRLAAGSPPVTAGQIVVGAQLARQAGLRVGSQVRLTGQGLPALRVTGIASDGRADAASDYMYRLFFRQSVKTQAVALSHRFAAELFDKVIPRFGGYDRRYRS